MQTVKEDEVKKFADELPAEFIKTSTKTGYGINDLDKLFEIIWIDLLTDAQSNQENVEEEKSKCCGCSKCCKCFHRTEDAFNDRRTTQGHFRKD